MGLEVEGVTVRFGGHVALNNVNIWAHEGKVTGLIGPNGAGKTTIFNVITGLQPPSSGRVRMDGRDVSRLAPYRRARLGMARTFQRLELFGSLTVRENIQIAAAQYRRLHRGTKETPQDTAARLLHRLALTEIAHVRADQLPTGQGRVVELARSLASRPKILLLDEPASGQDDEETRGFGQLLREIADDGVAVLLVEHDMDLVMNTCDELHVLDFGKKIANGTCDEIRRNAAVQAAYLGTADAAAADEVLQETG
ncbi:ABC transporter ATP-binding protein [Embleya sp. AB8]|uniref:ABC transporter ATP-binding protein n=1 Tax=Embleya sp. AB8 TaxID=3156304 RepID=UPI003C730AFD